MKLKFRLIEPVKGIINLYNTPMGTLIKRDLFDGTSFIPYVDIYSKEDRFVIKAELPGIKKNDIKIYLKDKILTIRGKKRGYDNEKDNNKLIQLERSFGEFQRRFRGM